MNYKGLLMPLGDPSALFTLEIWTSVFEEIEQLSSDYCSRNLLYGRSLVSFIYFSLAVCL